MKFYITLAIKNFKNNGLKFRLNILSIVAGVILLTTILTLSTAFKSVLYEQMKVSGEEVLTVAVGNKVNTLNYKYLPVFDNKTIESVINTEHVDKCVGVKAGNAASVNFTQPDGKNQLLLSNSIFAADIDFLNMYGAELEQGRFCKGDDEIVIGSTIASSNNISLGDTIVIGYGSNTYNCKVSGIISKMQEKAYSTNPAMINNMLLVSSENHIFSGQNYYFAVAKIDNVKCLQEVSNSIEENLNSENNINSQLKSLGLNVVVVSQLDVLSMIDNWFVYVNAFVFLLFIIVSIIVILNLSNMMVMTILQRSREIGVLKTIGGLNSQVSHFYTIECSIIGIIGTVIGLIVSIILCLIIGILLNWPIQFNIIHFLFIFIVGIGSPIIAGLFTQSKIKKMSPINAFNNEQ